MTTQESRGLKVTASLRAGQSLHANFEAYTEEMLRGAGLWGDFNLRITTVDTGRHTRGDQDGIRVCSVHDSSVKVLVQAHGHDHIGDGYLTPQGGHFTPDQVFQMVRAAFGKFWTPGMKPKNVTAVESPNPAKSDASVPSEGGPPSQAEERQTGGGEQIQGLQDDEVTGLLKALIPMRGVLDNPETLVLVLLAFCTICESTGGKTPSRGIGTALSAELKKELDINPRGFAPIVKGLENRGYVVRSADGYLTPTAKTRTIIASPGEAKEGSTQPTEPSPATAQPSKPTVTAHPSQPPVVKPVDIPATPLHPPATETASPGMTPQQFQQYMARMVAMAQELGRAIAEEAKLSEKMLGFESEIARLKGLLSQAEARLNEARARMAECGRITNSQEHRAARDTLASWREMRLE